MKVEVQIPPKLIPVFLGEARYRGAYGGRGSAKTRTFAKMTAVRALMFAEAGHSGLILCTREFMNSLDESSMAEVKAAITSEPWLAERFDIGEKYIRTMDRRVEYAFSGMRHNVDSLKSKARILLNWNDEAEPVSETAWQKLIPTVREDDSEIWVTWNPELEESATHKRFRQNPPDGSKIVELNWRDNPWFPAVLKAERLEDKAKRPHNYEHIWEGAFITLVEGAYFASHLATAKEEGRIGNVAADPLMRLRAYCDLGGPGARADAFSMWIVQFVGREIRVLNYYEAQGQEIGEHLGWLNEHGYRAGGIDIYLPHDGLSESGPRAGSWESAFRAAGYHAQTLFNEGSGAQGARSVRIEAVRRMMPSIWFNADTTVSGRKALGWYHEKVDEKRRVGLGPEHDWASHGADAFGLMAVAYEIPAKAHKLDLSNLTRGRV